MRAAAEAEQGVVAFEKYVNGTPDHFFQAMSRFGSALRLTTSELLASRILMNVSQACKMEGLHFDKNTYDRFVLRQKAIGCVLTSLRLHKTCTVPVLDVAAVEMFEIGSDFTDVVDEEHIDHLVRGTIRGRPANVSDAIHASIDQFLEILRNKKFPKYSAPKKKLIPGTPFELGQLVWTPRDLKAVSSTWIIKMALGCLDLSVSMCDDTAERLERKAIADVFTCRMFASFDTQRSNVHATKAIEYFRTSKVCDEDVKLRYYPEAFCFKASALSFKNRAFEAMTMLIQTMDNDTHDDVGIMNMTECLKCIAMEEYQQHKATRVKNVKEIIQAIIREEDTIPLPK